MALIYGILAWPLIAAFAVRVLGFRQRWRWIGWGLAAGVVVGSLLASSDLTGALVVAVWMAVGIAAVLSPALSPPARFLWILIAGGAALLLIPELLYLRDAFDGSALFRMNTVFKAGYQAFLLLGLAAACALPVGGRLAPAPRLDAAGRRSPPSCCCSGSSTPTRAATRGPAGSRTRPRWTA